MLAGLSAARADPLRVGTTGDYKPLTWHDPTTRTFSGTDIDLVEAFADDQGLKIRFVKTTWPTLSADLAAGKFAAAIGGISRTPERARDFLLSVTIKTTGKVALVRCGDVPRFGSLADIDKAPITVVENSGGTNETFAKKNIKHAMLIVVPNNIAPFSYLKDGRADVMFTDSIEALYQQRASNGVLCAVKPDAPYTHVEKVVMFAKNRRNLRNTFNRWFKARRQQ
ncbi:MAG: transporter substrate-binding domain-containing protein [Alphaproteobacteria bacterium]|nr:transporter substrate-binding domain-containing protein [Alphaproteobacteria bacterium]